MEEATELPYKKTYLIPILKVAPIQRPYVHPRGAITIVRYVAPRRSEHRALDDASH